MAFCFINVSASVFHDLNLFLRFIFRVFFLSLGWCVWFHSDQWLIHIHCYLHVGNNIFTILRKKIPLIHNRYNMIEKYSYVFSFNSMLKRLPYSFSRLCVPHAGEMGGYLWFSVFFVCFFCFQKLNTNNGVFFLSTSSFTLRTAIILIKYHVVSSFFIKFGYFTAQSLLKLDFPTLVIYTVWINFPEKKH